VKKSTRAQLAPRKQPRQARSIATRSALLEAAAQVLETIGYEKMTTTRVADRAGTSVGSIYQYFPSKDALLLALVEAKTERVDRALARAFEAPADVPLADRITLLVSGLIEEKRSRPRLHAELARQAPRLEKAKLIARMLDRTHGMVRALLQAHRDEIDVLDVDLSAWLLVHAVNGMVDAAVVGSSERLDDPRFVEAIVAHMLGALGIPGAHRRELRQRRAS
jgi:AcrR family transcriptional regulator